MTDINFHYLFGLPVLITSIDSNSYDKEKLLDTINKNYEKQKIRANSKTTQLFKTDIHNSNADEQNPLFEKLDYTSVSKCYNKPIEKYLSNITYPQELKYNFRIHNYTAVKHNSFMNPHIHPNCDFAMVHYVSFDSTQHLSTVFLNPYFFSGFIRNETTLINALHKDSVASSWVYEEWVYKVKEDDVIIFPSILKHYIRNLDSDKLRVTFASNISINK
tara:strand:- start:40 stop:693 length:654 start_codon:yes stop_codon:yes gene_type:complete